MTTQVERAAIERALNDTVLRVTGPIAFALAPLYLLFAVAHSMLLPPAQAKIMSPVAAATAVAFLGLGAATRSNRVPRSAAHVAAAAISLAVWLNSSLHVFVAREIHQTTNLGLLVVGSAALFLSTRWFVLLAVITAASFAASLAALPPSPLAMHFVFYMMSAMVLAIVVFRARRTSAVRIEGLRVSEGAQKKMLAELSTRLQELFDNMRDGIVVIDRDARVVGAVSREATRIFGGAAAPGVRVAELLHPDEPEGGVERAALDEWIALAFAAAPAEWDAVDELAPRRALVAPGRAEARSLALEFRPIVDGDRVERVMMLVRDESEKHRLERAMRAQEESFARRLSAVRRLVAGGGQALVSFLRSAEARVTRATELARAPTAGDLGELFQHVHVLKGEADTFELEELRDAAEAAEQCIAAAQRSGDARDVGDAIDTLAERVRDARGLLVRASPIGEAILGQTTVDGDDVARLHDLAGARSDDVGELARRLASRPFGELVGPLVQRVPNWAEGEGTRARVEVRGANERIAPRVAEVLPSVITQLARNAIAHGIEPPEARTSAGKPAAGTVVVDCAPTPDGPRIVVADDGRGVAPGVAARMFERGTSTRDVAGSLAGRGYGLAAVAADLARVGYAIAHEPTDVGARFVLAPARSRVS